MSRLHKGNKCTLLVKDVGNGGGYALVEALGLRESSVPFDFFGEPKSTLKKIKSYKKTKAC